VSSFVIYTDKLPLDATAAQPVIKLLQSVGVQSCSPNYVPPRDQEELPVSSFVIYTDKLPLDATAAQPVIKLLQSVGVQSCSPNYVPPRKENSYLYM